MLIKCWRQGEGRDSRLPSIESRGKPDGKLPRLIRGANRVDVSSRVRQGGLP